MHSNILAASFCYLLIFHVYWMWFFEWLFLTLYISHFQIVVFFFNQEHPCMINHP